MASFSPPPQSTSTEEDIKMSAIQEISESRLSDDDDVDGESTDNDDSLVGAPVEKVWSSIFTSKHSLLNDCLASQINPLGNQVTLLSCTMLNLGQMLGSGIFSTPGVILNSVGSIGLLLLFWVLAPIFAYGMPNEAFGNVYLLP